jgi:hypothetical protein
LFCGSFYEATEYVESLKRNAVRPDEKEISLIKRIAFGTVLAIITILIEYALANYLAGYFGVEINQFSFIFSIFILCFFLMMSVGPKGIY